MDMLYEALRCASVGLRVFPLYEVMEDLRCACGTDGCKQPGKHPRVDVWPDKATTDEATIRNWWRRWPNAGLGMATGRKSGVWVLDLDSEDAIAWYAGKIREHGRSPTRGVQTGRGRHLYWKYPDEDVVIRNRVSVDERKIDTRGERGFVVLPPTRHYSGRHYEWRDQAPYQSEPAMPPDWLVEIVKHRPPPPPAKIVVIPSRVPWTAKAADDEMARRLRLEPAARQMLAERLGVVTEQHARKVKCPQCGDRSVWWMIHGTGYAKCSHLNSCGWLGPLHSLLG